jgi:hypothetical protein
MVELQNECGAEQVQNPEDHKEGIFGSAATRNDQ